MAFVARIYCDDRIYSLDSGNCDRATIGCDCFDTLKVEYCSIKKSQVVIEKSGNSYIIQSKNGMFDRNGSPISKDEIAIGNRYSINCEPPVYIAIHPKQEHSNQQVRLSQYQELHIGRGEHNNIILHNHRTSNNHCKLYLSSGVWKIRDLRSSNGTFVNGKKIFEKTLSDGDYINISVYVITFKDNTLRFFNVGEDMELNLQNIGEKKGNGFVSKFDASSREGRADHRATREKHATCERPTNGTISMFDTCSDQITSEEQEVTPANPPVKNGTISVFDIM